MTRKFLAYQKLDSHQTKIILFGASLFFLVLLFYIPATYCNFIWDDDMIITDNPIMKSPTGLVDIWFEPGAMLQYYPLVHTTSWIEYQLFGSEPLSYHLFNILFHAINSILVWFILRRLGMKGAWLAAAIFALHPVHVESVAWASERKNVLSGFFYLLSLFMFLKYWNFGEIEKKQNETKYYYYSLFSYLCALHSKTVVCTLPVVILLVVYSLSKQRLYRKLLICLIPYFIVGFTMGVLTMILEKKMVGADGSHWAFSLGERCIIAGKAFWFYIGKLIYPVNLNFVYPKWDISPHRIFNLFFPAGALLCIIFFWLKRGTISKIPFLCLSFFAITIFPALGFFNVFPTLFAYVADHFQYLASIGPLTLLVVVMGVLIERLGEKKFRFVGLILSTPIVLTLGVFTWNRCLAFKDQETLWIDTITKNPSAWLAHSNLGADYARSGQLEQAKKEFLESVRCNPNDDAGLRNLAIIEFERENNVEKAFGYYENAINVSVGYFNRSVIQADYGKALMKNGNLEYAEKQLYDAFRSSRQSNGRALASLKEVIKKRSNYNKKIENFPEPFVFDDRLYYSKPESV